MEKQKTYILKPLDWQRTAPDSFEASVFTGDVFRVFKEDGRWRWVLKDWEDGIIHEGTYFLESDAKDKCFQLWYNQVFQALEEVEEIDASEVHAVAA